MPVYINPRRQIQVPKSSSSFVRSEVEEEAVWWYPIPYPVITGSLDFVFFLLGFVLSPEAKKKREIELKETSLLRDTK
jgi:hypothetical protein